MKKTTKSWTIPLIFFIPLPIFGFFYIGGNTKTKEEISYNNQYQTSYKLEKDKTWRLTNVDDVDLNLFEVKLEDGYILKVKSKRKEGKTAIICRNENDEEIRFTASYHKGKFNLVKEI